MFASAALQPEVGLREKHPLGEAPSAGTGLLLAGANRTDRLLAGLGAFLGLVCTAVGVYSIPGVPSGLPHLIAPIGASAVLAFAIPSSPLAQPWALIGGNAVSAGVGLLVGSLLSMQWLAAAVAVAGAILIMSFLRCLHPPGGAVALFASLCGASGLAVLWLPLLVIANSAILVLTAWTFHRFSGHSYPHRAPRVQPPPVVSGVTVDDVDKALEELGETFDISREDLVVLLERAERHAIARHAESSVIRALQTRGSPTSQLWRAEEPVE